VVATSTEGFEPPRYKDAVLGLNYRLGVVPAGVVSAIAAPFLPLFWPPVVAAVLCGLLALDVWIVFVHGAGEGLLDIIYQPSLLFLFLGLELVALVWHECGHATACRYGGARPGRVGVGLYIIWFVLFCDVTDSYRLDKVGRLRTDCGGLYFDAIFTLAIGGAYFLTGFEPLLALALLNQLAALDELSPFVRFDGYYIVSDLTGVPNLYQYIPPVIKGLIPGREADESVKALKPWVRATITVWVLATVPVLLGGLVMLFYLGPWALAAAWDSFLTHYGEVLGALEDGSVIAGAKGVINILGPPRSRGRRDLDRCCCRQAFDRGCVALIARGSPPSLADVGAWDGRSRWSYRRAPRRRRDDDAGVVRASFEVRGVRCGRTRRGGRLGHRGLLRDRGTTRAKPGRRRPHWLRNARRCGHRARR
jgi:putative peptide zinc metalloprotease protein